MFALYLNIFLFYFFFKIIYYLFNSDIIHAFSEPGVYNLRTYNSVWRRGGMNKILDIKRQVL